MDSSYSIDIDSLSDLKLAMVKGNANYFEKRLKSVYWKIL